MSEPFDNKQNWIIDEEGSRKHGSREMTAHRLRSFTKAIEAEGDKSLRLVWLAVNAWHWALALQEYDA